MKSVGELPAGGRSKTRRSRSKEPIDPYDLGAFRKNEALDGRNGVPVKLVRDKIPDRMRRKGLEPLTRSLRGSTLVEFLISKLTEESEEVRDAYRAFRRVKADKNKKAIRAAREKLLEECADTVEVFSAIIAQLDIAQGELCEARKKKLRKAGGFLEGYLLTGILELRSKTAPDPWVAELAG